MTVSPSAMSPQPPTISNVHQFWEANPLFSLESPFSLGSREFFSWHNQIRCEDVEAFAMHLYEFDQHAHEKVLDVGCGIGWLCWHFARNKANIIGIDLTRQGVELTRQRLALDSLSGTVLQASAEQLPFQNDSFDFVTSAGVLHHTPNTCQSVQEIYRVLRPGGRAMISLYYKNWFLSDHLWPLTRWLVRNLFGNVPGRQAFRQVQTVNDLVRIYDGNTNPLGKAYNRQQVRDMFSNFTIERLEVHYFPARFLPFGRFIQPKLRRLLDNYFGLMIYGSLRKDARVA